MTALLLALSLAGAPAAAHAPEASGADPYEGVYACTVKGNHYAAWVGTVGSGTREQTLWTRYWVVSPDDFPFEEEVRATMGSSYHTRGGGFTSGNSGVDFEGGTFMLDDTPCPEVQTIREMLVAFDLDPDDLVQEVMDLEGWTPEQVAARLDDAAFARAAFSPEANFRRNGRPTFARVLLGETLPEPPPPPNAAPTAAPEAADAYEGIYSDGRMLYLVRGGRFIQFTHESDSDWDQAFQYVFEPRTYYPRAYDYRVVDGEFTSGDESEMEFLRRDGQVAAMGGIERAAEQACPNAGTKAKPRDLREDGRAAAAV